MTTKIKPIIVETNNSPSVCDIIKYVDETTFEWGAWGWGGAIYIYNKNS